MFIWLLIWLLVGVIIIRTVNYGRWTGKQGNIRGAVGLYILAVTTGIIAVFVYLLNNLR